ncbi:MAG: hypothetical protein IPK79_12470 [Vampirovibrionales bacterium]|nr:hypothetical protein [Vampirovibrionales bacterium]
MTTIFPRRLSIGAISALAALLAVSVALAMPWSASAQVRAGGRLSGLIQQKSSLYLPTRLLWGQENRILVKAPPGARVVVYISPQNQGFTAPNGAPLRVGADPEKLEGVASEKGVAALTLTLPAPPAGEGLDEEIKPRPAFLDAVVYQKDDFSDMTVVEIIDPTGRPAASNQTMLTQAVNGRGPLFFPGMPGVSGDIVRRLSTLGDLQSGDTRKRELIDDGTRNQQVEQDRNVFIRRADQLSQP